MNIFKKMLWPCIALLLVVPITAMADGTNHTIMFDLQNKHTYVDDNPQELDVPPELVNDHLFVPIRFLSTYLNFTTNWDPATHLITINTKNAVVKLQQETNTATVNGQTIPFDSVAIISHDRLQLSARAVANFLGIDINYDPGTRQATIVMGKILKPGNARPIAQFTTDKKVYRIGEPIEYIDLSYDPDGTGYYPSWSGNAPAFFTPGKKQITLTVKDPKGSVSEPFTQTIEISDDVMLTADEYPFYFGGAGDDPKILPLNYPNYASYQVMQKTEPSRDTTRKLLVSDSPETVKEHGILYQDKVSGKARLYATHVNETDDMLEVAVMASNPTSQPVKITTTHLGQAAPSTFPELQGQQALIDWYLKGEQTKELVVQPGQSVVLYRTAPLYPHQGMHFLEDVEVTGQANISFIAKGVDDQENIQQLSPLPRSGNVRGTFDATRIDWVVDGSQLRGVPGRIIIGNAPEDAWVKGQDAMTGAVEEDKGNYGVSYHIEIKKPGKVALALVSRGGMYKGVVVSNGTILPIPESGVVRPQTNAYLIGRTTGAEDSIKLEIVPPSGSALPFDILVYPLKQLK